MGTAHAPTRETEEQGALLLSVPWDRFISKSLVSVPRRISSKQGSSRRGGLKVKGQPLCPQEAPSGKAAPGKVLDNSPSSGFCIRVDVTPGISEEREGAVEGMGGSWPRPPLSTPMPPDSPSPAGWHLTSEGCLLFSCLLPSRLLLCQHLPRYHGLKPMRPAAPESSNSVTLSQGPEARNS